MKYIVTLNGKNYEVDVTETDAVLTSVTEAVAPAPAPVATPVQAVTPAAPAAQSAVAGEAVKAPMPGNILSVNVSAGQSVNAGDVLFILEAMKMENEIVAPASGTVKQVLVSKGSVVDTDEVLAVL